MILILAWLCGNCANMGEVANKREADQDHGMGQLTSGMLIKIQNQPIDGTSQNFVMRDFKSRIDTVSAVRDAFDGICSAPPTA